MCTVIVCIHTVYVMCTYVVWYMLCARCIVYVMCTLYSTCFVCVVQYMFCVRCTEHVCVYTGHVHTVLG